MLTWAKRGAGIVVIVVGIGLLIWAFQPTAVIVDVQRVRRDTLEVTVDDDGRTRVRERYTISAPIQGRLLRMPLDPGDEVQAGKTTVAEFVPVSPDLLDARSRREARARFLRAEAAREEAEARAAQTEAEVELAASEFKRVEQLVNDGHESVGALDRARRNERQARAGERAARFGVQVARYEIELARAGLVESAEEDPGAQENGTAWTGTDDDRLLIRSPITGKVLRVFEESARTLDAGSEILEVGNTSALEIVADYLSQDAVKVGPGMRVRIEGWGGDRPGEPEPDLTGRVRVVEPSGFTKVSALGVEEQRVSIIVDPVGDASDWTELGDGYRVELSIVLWEADGVLIVPTGALFRDADSWAVFVAEEGRARRRPVRIGYRSGLEAQVLGGLDEGEVVVLYPSELIGEGTRVRAR